MYSGIQRCGGYYSWHHGYWHLLIHLPSLTHSTHGATQHHNTQYLCILVSVGMCISVWVSVLLCLLVIQGVVAYSTSHYCIPSGRTTTHYIVCCRYYCIACQAVYMIPRTLRSYGTSISRYPSVSRYMSSCELHYNITVRRRT